MIPSFAFSANQLPLGLSSVINPVGGSDESTAALDLVLAPGQQFSFSGSHVKEIERSTSSQLRFDYSWKLNSYQTLKFKTTSDFENYSTSKTVHRMDLRQHIPVKSANTYLRLFWQKYEHVNEQTGIELNVNKPIRIQGKSVFNLRTITGWTQQVVSGETTIRHETRWVLSRKFKFSDSRDISLNGTIRWREKRESLTDDTSDWGGFAQARLNVSPRLNLLLKHVTEDEFSAELTKLSGTFSGTIWRSKVYLEAGTDNNHDGFLEFSATKSWQ